MLQKTALYNAVFLFDIKDLQTSAFGVIVLEFVEERGSGMSHHIQKIAEGSEWKGVLSVSLTAFSFFQGFYGNLIWGFLCLFVIDFITGILKSRKNQVPITSKKLRESVSKLGAYMLLLTSLIVCSKFQPEFISLVTATYYWFMFTELKSIVENVEQLGVKIPKALRGYISEKDKEEEK